MCIRDSLGIGHALELLGQGAQALGQQGQLGGANTQLAGLGAEHLALDTDDIAHVQLLEGSIGLLAQLVAADIQPVSYTHLRDMVRLMRSAMRWHPAPKIRRERPCM